MKSKMKNPKHYYCPVCGQQVMRLHGSTDKIIESIPQDKNDITNPFRICKRHRWKK
jgi:C4-type Zn-finger protein